MTNSVSWPENPEQWRAAFEGGLDMSPSEGKDRWARGDLDTAPVLDWFRATYSAQDGYHPDFVDALSRNVLGLLAWVYGDGEEPYWPGSDADRDSSARGAGREVPGPGAEGKH